MANFNQSFNISSDEPVNNPCKPCSDAGIPKEATSFCVDCGELLCQKCLLDHNKFSTLKSHQIVGVSQYEVSKRQSKVVSLPTERCEAHHGKLIDMFCEDHDEVCCAVCIAVQHRSCDKVKYIPEIVPLCKDTLKVQRAIEMADELLGSFSEAKNIRNSNLTMLDNQKAESVKKIDVFEENFIKKIKELADITRGQIQEKHQCCVNELNAEIAKIKNEKTLINGHKQKLEGNADGDSHLFVGVKLLKKLLKNSEEVLKSIIDGHSTRTLTMHIHTNLVETLSSLASLGETLTGPATCKAELYRKYNVKTAGDSNRCDINTVCVLSGGDMLLSDFVNSNIKRLDRQCKIIDSLQVVGSPSSICRISPSQVAVSLGEEQKVLIVDVDDGMKTVNSFDLGRKCNGINFFEDNLYVCFGRNSFHGENGQISIYNINGEILRVYEKNSLGNFIFSFPIQVAFINGWDRFFVADRVCGLFCLDKGGRVIWRFSYGSLDRKSVV